MQIDVSPLVPGDVPDCERILRSLPEWFAIESANEAYVKAMSELTGFVARVDGNDGPVAGCLLLGSHGPASVEIHLMCVERALHRSGVGRALVDVAEEWCEAHGVRWLHVKTRGPSAEDGDSNYARTRAFYTGLGFDPLFETPDLWGPQDPALILVKHLP